MKLSNEVKAGLVAVVGIIILIYGYNFLKATDILASHRQYYGVYDRIEGLEIGNMVQINGFTVGKINKIEFHPDLSGRIVVGFVLNKEAPSVPANSVARIESQDILGTKILTIRLGDALNFTSENDTLRSDIEGDLKTEVDKRIAPLEQKTRALISSVDSAVTIVQHILNKDARENLSKSFEGIKRAIITFEKTALTIDTLMVSEKERIQAIMANLASVTTNLKKTNESLVSTIDNLALISDSLAHSNLKATIRHMDTTLAGLAAVLEKVRRGEGSLGKVVHNDSLYYYLQQSSMELEKLLRDARENPDRYVHFSVFGKKDKRAEKPPGKKN